MEQPPSCGHGVQTKIQGLVGNPLCMPPWGSQGVVLLSPKVWNGRHGGEDLAIGIACFATPPPLTRDQTHTHKHTHTHTLSSIVVAPPTSPPPQKPWMQLFFSPPHTCRQQAVRSCTPTSAEADCTRDDAAPARARWYPPFTPIASLRMQSDDGDGADSPTLLEDKGNNRTSDRNWHMVTFT